MEAGPLGAQPPPQLLELAASKVADSTAFDNTGFATLRPLDLSTASAGVVERGRGMVRGQGDELDPAAL